MADPARASDRARRPGPVIARAAPETVIARAAPGDAIHRECSTRRVGAPRLDRGFRAKLWGPCVQM